mgnify:CR=1 FL=1
MLAIWEYFWLEADWTAASDAATAVTLTGPSLGQLNRTSEAFIVGANGSISAVLVVTISNTGGTGVLSQSVFSLSVGTTTVNFTYTPSTLGTHNLLNTNNQTLIDAATLTYEVASFGKGKGHKGDSYQPLPDKYWEDFRKRHIAPAPKSMFNELAENEVSQVITSIQQKKEDNFLAEVQAIMELQTQLAQIQQQQQMLSAQMPQVPDIATLKVLAAQLRTLEFEIPSLTRQLQFHIATATRLRALLRNSS